MNQGDRVVAVHDVVESGFDEPDRDFLHASAGDVGEIVGFGEEAPTFLVQWGETIAEVFREEIRLCVPFPADAQDAPEP